MTTARKLLVATGAALLCTFGAWHEGYLRITPEERKLAEDIRAYIHVGHQEDAQVAEMAREIFLEEHPYLRSIVPKYPDAAISIPALVKGARRNGLLQPPGKKSKVIYVKENG